MNIEATNRTAGRDTDRRLSTARLSGTRRPSRPPNTLETLKNRLLSEQLGAETNEELIRRLRRAADESASLAWASPFPLLTLPELLTEKIREAQRQFERQRAIQSRGRNVLQAAA
jgi:hypothetical protein